MSKLVHRRDYVEARRAAYPEVGQQLDALMKYFAALPEIPAELQDWVLACQLVKDTYPKPTEDSHG